MNRWSKESLAVPLHQSFHRHCSGFYNSHHNGHIIAARNRIIIVMALVCCFGQLSFLSQREGGGVVECMTYSCTL